MCETFLLCQYLCITWGPEENCLLGCDAMQSDRTEDGGSKFLWEGSKFLPYYMASHLTSSILHSGHQENIKSYTSCKGKTIPLHVWTGPEGSGTHISKQSEHEGSKVVSLKHRPPLHPSKYSWYAFLLEAVSTPGPQCDRRDYLNKRFQRHHREHTSYTEIIFPCLHMYTY